MHHAKLQLIYEDDYFVAINKPAGLVVHRSILARQERQFALQMVRDQIGKLVYPVHRLDKPTSGVLLFALSPEIAKKTSNMFTTNSVHKKYMAVVRGHTENEGIINHALKKVKDKLLISSEPDNCKKQEALTDYKRIAIVEIPQMVDKYPTSRYSLVELTPKHGRRHQLRRHMKHISHPIIGDTEYGKSKHNNYFRKTLNCHRLLLSATKLHFIHPVTNNEIIITAELDMEFVSILKEFGWQM